MAALHYRKIINGVGYRFALPFLAPPPPSGHWANVTVAIFPKDAANLLRAPPSSADKAVPYPSAAVDENLTLDVFAAGAYWLLPLLQPIDKNSQRVYVVKAQRMPDSPNNREALASPPSSSSAIAPPPSSGAVAPPSSSRVPPPAPSSNPVLPAPSSSPPAPPSSEDAVAPLSASSAVIAPSAVAVTHPQCAGQQVSLVDAESKAIVCDVSDDAPESQVSCEEARVNAYAAKSSSANERKSIPFNGFCPNGTSVDPTEEKPRSGFYNEVQLDLNDSYAYRINQTRYVDVLPKGDKPSTGTKDSRRGLLGPKRWSVSKEFRIWFRFARIPKDTRKIDWYLLTGSGIPCTVRGKFIEVQGLGCPERSLEVTTNALSDGEARYKLVPISLSEYACQPTAASAEASHIFSLYHIVIEQNGQEHRAFEPAGQCLDFEWQRHLRILGQYSSAESARSLIYSVDCHLDGTAEYVNGFGVRLRDGGSRLPLRLKAGEQGVAQIELPGELSLYNEWGAYIAPPSSLQACYSKIVVDVRLSLGDSPTDLVLKVEDQDEGDYHRMQYALRPRGDLKPVRRDEWKPLDLDIINLSARRYMINVARSTVGRGLLESSTGSSS